MRTKKAKNSVKCGFFCIFYCFFEFSKKFWSRKMVLYHATFNFGKSQKFVLKINNRVQKTQLETQPKSNIFAFFVVFLSSPLNFGQERRYDNIFSWLLKNDLNLTFWDKYLHGDLNTVLALLQLMVRWTIGHGGLTHLALLSIT